MKLRLDENLGERGRQQLEAAGPDVCTVPLQGLVSATDRDLLVRCVAEARALVTLDLDFANPLVFPPSPHRGVAVLRLPRKPVAGDIEAAVATLVAALRTQSLDREWWIVKARARAGLFIDRLTSLPVAVGLDLVSSLACARVMRRARGRGLPQGEALQAGERTSFGLSRSFGSIEGDGDFLS